MKPKQLLSLYLVFVALLLLLILPGKTGNPKIQELGVDPKWTEEGAIFDNSSPRARYALLYSVVENDSFQFSLPLAHFATPDLAVFQDNYVSLFPPGVSLIAIPGYLIGKYFGLGQVGAFATIPIFAFFNFVLMQAISRRLGASLASALLAGLIFLFASPAFAYSATLYQHHISVFLLLISFYACLALSTYWATFLFLFLFGISLFIDYPLALLFIPIGIYLLHRIFDFKVTAHKIKIRFNPWIFSTFLALALGLIPFFWTNWKSYGNPLQLAGTLKRVQAISTDETPIYETYLYRADNKELIDEHLAKDKKSYKFFNSRLFLSGLYTHLISEDRGIIYYAPLILVGFIYAIITLKSFTPEIATLIGIISINLIIYSMWGDPWGGWAFGSRYLIPAYALVSILIAIALSKTFYKKSVGIALFALLVYSILINSLGSITSTNIPPKAEILALEQISGQEQKYNYLRNLDYMKANHLKPILYNAFLEGKIPGIYYYYLISSLAIIGASGLLVIYLKNDN